MICSMWKRKIDKVNVVFFVLLRVLRDLFGHKVHNGITKNTKG